MNTFNRVTMVRKTKRDGFNKNDLMKLIASVDENIKVFYKSGFASLEDYVDRMNAHETMDLNRFFYENKIDCTKIEQSTRFLFVFYKDGIYHVHDGSKQTIITISGKTKANLDDIKRFLLAKQICRESLTDCQICYRDVVPFNHVDVFNNFYYICGRCGFVYCIECLYHLTKDGKSKQCVCCKCENFNLQWQYWSDDHPTFLRHLQGLLKAALEDSAVSKEEFDKWISIHEENRL